MDETITIAGENTTAYEEENQFGVRLPFDIAITICTVQTIAIVAGNSLTVYAYWTSPTLQKSLHNLLICNLCGADLVVAVVGPLLYTIIRYTEAGITYTSDHKYACLIAIVCIGTSVNMSLAAISLLCSERFVAVIFPYKYYNWITERSVRVAITISHILAFVSTTPPLFGWNNWQAGNICSGVYSHSKQYIDFLGTLRISVILTTILMNMCIAKVTFTKNRISVANNPVNDQPDLNSPYKNTKMLLTVFGVYYACWMPFVITTIMYRSDIDRSTTFLICHEFTKILVALNSSINPLIYTLGNAEFRKAFKDVVHHIFPLQQGRL